MFIFGTKHAFLKCNVWAYWSQYQIVAADIPHSVLYLSMVSPNVRSAAGLIGGRFKTFRTQYRKTYGTVSAI
jgi:hypothetical protein